MGNRRGLTRAFATSLMVIGFTVVGTGSAQAVGACDSGAFCAYKLNDLNAGGSHAEWQGSASSWPATVRNAENSVKNNGTSGMSVQVYDQLWYVDSHYCLYKGHSLNLPSNKDEDGESHKWANGLTGCF